MKYLNKKIRSMKKYWFRHFYAILDGRVNSVTLGKCLYKHMMRDERESTEICVFKASDTQMYCFVFREDFLQLASASTVFTELQYNTEHEKIGFRTDQPSVNFILSEYGLPIDKAIKLSVYPRKTGNGQVFYEIQRPQQNIQV